MTKPLRVSVLSCLLAFAALPGSAQVTLSALSSFGGGDGWLAPGENGYAFLTAGNTERGLAYNPDTGRLYLVSRAGGLNVRMLSGTTGLDPLTNADLGSLSVSGISGGTFALSTIAVGNDGVIYGANLKTGSASDDTFKVYRWGSEAEVPNPIYTGTALTGARTGDILNVIGGGTATRLVAGYAAGTVNTTANGFGVLDPTVGALTSIAPNGAAAGNFRLGVTFLDADTVIGTQGQTGPLTRLVDFNEAAGTGVISASFALQTSGERPMDFAVVGGMPLLATIETGGAATANTVHLYDMTNPASPLHLTSLRNTGSTVTANTNGVGALNWGAITGNTATLYAMNGNNGIQAFVVTVPEPTAGALLLAGLTAFGSRRLRRRG